MEATALMNIDRNSWRNWSSCPHSDQDTAGGLFISDLPPPANVVMETLQLFWGPLSSSLSLMHAHYAAWGCYATLHSFHVTPTFKYIMKKQRTACERTRKAAVWRSQTVPWWREGMHTVISELTWLLKHVSLWWAEKCVFSVSEQGQRVPSDDTNLWKTKKMI